MTGGADHAWRAADGGVTVRVRLTPKSSRDAIEGIEATADGPAVKARVRAVPEDGAANEAVLRLVARWLGVPVRAASLAAGAKSRVKSIHIAGDALTVTAALEEWRAGLGCAAGTRGEE